MLSQSRSKIAFINSHSCEFKGLNKALFLFTTRSAVSVTVTLSNFQFFNKKGKNGKGYVNQLMKMIMMHLLGS